MPIEAEQRLKQNGTCEPERTPASSELVSELAAFLGTHDRICVLSGAGCSTASGIPDYRDENGEWKHARPVQFAEFIGNAAVRRRYWARSFAGWRRIETAVPNAAHHAIARLEARGVVGAVVTQNVDGLHGLAGSRNVIELHGGLHRVRCLGCAAVIPRTAFQAELGEMNGEWRASVAGFSPDGDARLGDSASDIDAFRVADCPACGAVLKPDVVFFGEPVRPDVVQRATSELLASDALLVVGSSLMVFSGFRFARIARDNGLPLAILNQGVTRADAIATLKLEGDCAALLPAALDRLPH